VSILLGGCSSDTCCTAIRGVLKEPNAHFVRELGQWPPSAAPELHPVLRGCHKSKGSIGVVIVRGSSVRIIIGGGFDAPVEAMGLISRPRRKEQHIGGLIFYAVAETNPP
jgi:hypothetical protein